MKEIVVLPVEPTYASTRDKEETVIAVIKDSTISTVVTIAKRISLISCFGFAASLPTRL